MLGFGKKKKRNINKRPAPLQTTRLYNKAAHDNEGGSSAKVWFRWAAGLSLCGVMLLALVVGMFQMHRTATNSSFFAIDRLEVRGATHYTRDAILQDTKLHMGSNALQYNIAEIKKILSQNPWVTSVAVKRDLPDAFEIVIEEKVPAFWVLQEGILYYADSQGRIIDAVQADNFLSLPTLSVVQGGEELLAQVEVVTTYLHKSQLPIDLSLVSQIQLSAGRGFELLLANHNLTLCIGAVQWAKNVDRMGQVLTDLAKRGELKEVREVWATDDNVWVVQAAKAI